MDDEFQLESDVMGKKGKSGGSNTGNVEKPIGKSASNELADRESGGTKDEEKSNQETKKDGAVIGDKDDKEDKKKKAKVVLKMTKNPIREDKQ